MLEKKKSKYDCHGQYHMATRQGNLAVPRTDFQTVLLTKIGMHVCNVMY